MTSTRARLPAIAGLLVSSALLVLGLQGRVGRADLAGPDCQPPRADPGQIAAFLRAGCYRGWPHDQARVRKTGPAPGEKAPHGKVRVYYSPEVYAWLKAGRPASGVPDGGFIFKEMYDWDKERLTGGAYMLKRRGRSFDGWYWGGFGVGSGKAWGAWANAGCLNCHASAERELTFATLGFIEGTEADATTPVAAAPGKGHAPRHRSHLSPPPRQARREQPEELEPEPSARRGPTVAFAARYPISFTVGRATSFRLPDENLTDDYVAGAKGPDPFLPSPTCVRCHDGDPPEVMGLPSPDDRGWLLDLSPASEWGGSLMALAGRDPVFFAQLEHEKALRPGFAGYLDDTCYRCHGVMGQRQLHLDQGRPFAHEMISAGARDPDAKYGALARDGVSCAVCHHIAEGGLGKEESLSGQFQIGPAREVYGPYDSDVKGKPMEAALGITPRGAAHVRSSALCGSCHTVLLPRAKLRSAGKAPRGEAVHEQATYLEWRNSAYQDEARPVEKEARSCQGCHMPVEYTGDDGKRRALTSKIANIEEYLPQVKTSLARKDLDLPERRPYARHTLVGLNYFVLSMFDQFDRLLGVPQPEPPGAGDPERVLPGPALTRRETVRLAQRQTATVEFVGAPGRDGADLLARVRVKNLAGHKLPSGVGFRRAFLELRVLSADGVVLWASGRTDELGAILGGDGAPLPSELTVEPGQLQPHHQRITRQDQAQIYEERHADDEGHLTISFLGLFGRVKDNRLLPRGWRRTRQTAFMQPVAVGDDPAYMDGSGTDEVVYQVPFSDALRSATAVEATLYYQALPPYYLRQLFSSPGAASGKDTQRLYYITSRLAVPPASPIAGWKLRLASARAELAHGATLAP